MTFKETMAAIFSTAEGTYYKWKREKRPIIALLEKYFTKQDLEEFLQTGKISKFEVIQEQEHTYRYAKRQYFNVMESIGSLGNIVNKDFMDFYFNVLVYAKNNMERLTLYSPFDMQRASILFATERGFVVESKENTPLPAFEAGIELLGHFDCHINQFLFANIMQGFQPMLSIEIDDSEFRYDAKVEAYLHALLFALYEAHPDNPAEEKRVILFTVLNEFYGFFNLSTVSEQDFEQTSLDTMLKMHFDMVQKHFDKLLEAVRSIRQD